MPQDLMREVIEMTIPVIVLIGMFTFLSIAVYSDARKKEREAYYRSEVRKKLIEQWGPERAQQVIEVLKEDAKNKDLELLAMFGEEKPHDPRKHREHLMLAGLITAALGIGLKIGLQWLPNENGFANLGFIPMLVGVAILIHALFVVRVERQSRHQSESSQ